MLLFFVLFHSHFSASVSLFHFSLCPPSPRTLKTHRHAHAHVRARSEHIPHLFPLSPSPCVLPHLILTPTCYRWFHFIRDKNHIWWNWLNRGNNIPICHLFQSEIARADADIFGDDWFTPSGRSGEESRNGSSPGLKLPAALPWLHHHIVSALDMDPSSLFLF